MTCSSRSSVSNHLSINPSALLFPKFEEVSNERHISGIYLRSPRQCSQCKDLQTRCTHVIGEHYVADERRRFAGSSVGNGVTDTGQAFCVVAGLILLEVHESNIGIGARDP